jgi:hypothetical protein
MAVHRMAASGHSRWRRSTPVGGAWAVPVSCGLSMADESSSYIEVGPFSNSRRMGRGESLTVGVLMQRTPPCLGDSIWPTPKVSEAI